MPATSPNGTVHQGTIQTVHSKVKSRYLPSLIAAPILLFLALAAWAFASPAGASPDDDFHLASIWCGLGDRDALCETTGQADTRMVPEPLLDATCYAFLPEQSAECWDADAQGLGEAPRLNTAPLYPPLFYGTMSIFASPDVQTSVIAMRLFNAALYVAMITAVFIALPRTLRPALVISALGTIVPLGLFIIPSTNPSSWALLSATTVWISLYGALRSSGRQQLVLAGLAVLGVVIGAGARADAAAFALFGMVLAALLGLRRGRSALVPAVAAGIMIIVCVALFLSAKQGGAVVNGLPTSNPPLTTGQHLNNLMGIPMLWTGALGGGGVGWLDTIMPAIVPTLAAATFFGAFAIGIRRLDLRHAIAVGLTIVALWAVPFVLLAQSRSMVGSDVQPRYLLPLLVIALGVASLRTNAEVGWRGPRSIAAGAALSAAALAALHTNINRYTKGIDDVSLDPGVRSEWWWSAAPSPSALLIVGGLAFAGLFAVIVVALYRKSGTRIVTAHTVNDRENRPSAAGHRLTDSTPLA